MNQYDFTLLTQINWALLALRILVFTKHVFDISISGGRKVANGLLEYSRPNEWLFFEENATPVPAWKFQEGGVASAKVSWRFVPDTWSFYSGTGETLEKQLPWLSAEIKCNNFSLYSLDDFNERVRYFGKEAPSPAVLIGAWSIGKGIMLSQSLDLSLHAIDEYGNDISFPITSKHSAVHNTPVLSETTAPVIAFSGMHVPIVKAEDPEIKRVNDTLDKLSQEFYMEEKSA